MYFEIVRTVYIYIYIPSTNPYLTRARPDKLEKGNILRHVWR